MSMSDAGTGRFLPVRLDRRCLLAGLAAFAATPVWAQGRTDVEGTNILRSLAPQDRLQRLGGPPVRRPARRVITVTIIDGGLRQTVRLDLSRRVDVTVFFGNDSTDLTGGAQAALSRLARALNSDILADQSFLIAGHTNTVGARDYNLQLSAGRADAVKEWLGAVGGVSPTRLFAHGFGPDMLRNASNPTSAVNRRVEIIAIDL
jgi:outer membrane protein OmpA-like peptidoglycan-associated protein